MSANANGMEWRLSFLFDFLPSFLPFLTLFASPDDNDDDKNNNTFRSSKASSAAAMEAGAVAPPNTAAAEARYRALYDEQVGVRANGESFEKCVHGMVVGVHCAGGA